MTAGKYDAVAIGVSAGGLEALSRILAHLPADMPLPIMVVQHVAEDMIGSLGDVLARKGEIRVTEAEDKEVIQAGTVYMAPPGYHLLVEEDRTLSLSVDPPVCHARPSIDVLFETAADVYGDRLVAVVLTGANSDGVEGLKRVVKEVGGLAVVQDPATAEASFLPTAALAATQVDHVVPIADMGRFLADFIGGGRKG